MNNMKNVLILVLVAFILISATVVTNQIVINQPKVPSDIKVVKYTSLNDIEETKQLQHYNEQGYIVKWVYHNNNITTIIFEKY